MQKKLIVLAVSGALGVPLAAFAQTNVSIYGRANMGLDRYSAIGSTVAGGDYVSRMRIFDSGSRLGFRGSENLGGGMEAYLVLETGVNWDSGRGFGQSGVNNAASTGFPASRDSFLGIKAGWGEVSFGRQSIFWANGLNAQTGANYINASADGLLTGLQMVAAPFTRQSNVVYYTSPRMAGLDVAFAFTPDTQEPGTFTGSGVNVQKGSGWGLNLKYRLGGLYVQADHAINKNKGNFSGTTDKGDKIGVSYAYMPNSRAAFIYQRLKNEQITAATAALMPAGVGAAAGDTPKESMWGVNIEHAIGQLMLYGGYFRGGEVTGFSGTASNTKSTAYHIGAKQHLSKRTGVYVSYNKIKNESNAMADLTGGGYTSAIGGPGAAGMGGASGGADVTVWAVGMMHNF
jgi:predicted porin